MYIQTHGVNLFGDDIIAFTEMLATMVASTSKVYTMGYSMRSQH